MSYYNIATDERKKDFFEPFKKECSTNLLLQGVELSWEHFTQHSQDTSIVCVVIMLKRISWKDMNWARLINLYYFTPENKKNEMIKY